MDSERRTRIAAAVARATSYDLATYPQEVCDAAVAILGVAGASLSVTTDGEARASWASNGVSHGLENTQAALGEGPALDVARGQAAVLEPFLDESSRWPLFRQAAHEAGVAGVFALPLQVGAICLGVLTLYRNTCGFFTDDELADALCIAEVVTNDLLDLSAASAIPTRWGDAGGHHAQVHQATGMISVQINSGLVDALARLRAHAFSEGRTLHDVATDVIDGHIRFEES